MRVSPVALQTHLRPGLAGQLHLRQQDLSDHNQRPHRRHRLGTAVQLDQDCAGHADDDSDRGDRAVFGASIASVPRFPIDASRRRLGRSTTTPRAAQIEPNQQADDVRGGHLPVLTTLHLRSEQ